MLSSVACLVPINGMIFRKKILNTNVVLILSTNLSEALYILRIDERDMIKKVYCPLFFSDFNETWIFRQSFEKYISTKFNENPYCESRVVSCGQAEGRTDRHEELNSRLRNFPKGPKKYKYEARCTVIRVAGLYSWWSNKLRRGRTRH